MIYPIITNLSLKIPLFPVTSPATLLALSISKNSCAFRKENAPIWAAEQEIWVVQITLFKKITLLIHTVTLKERIIELEGASRII